MAAIKLLIIDKEAAATGALLGDLKKRGMQCLHVDSYDEGLSKAIAQKPDILILDVSGAEGAQGWGAFLRYKKVSQLAETCFVIVGHGIEEKVFDEHRKLTRHADVYLRKPLSAALLLESLPERIKARMADSAGSAEKAQAAKDKSAQDDSDAVLLDELDSLLGPVGSAESSGGSYNGEPDLSELDRMLGVSPSPAPAAPKAAPGGPSFGGMAEREHWLGGDEDTSVAPLPPPLPHESQLFSSAVIQQHEPVLPPLPAAVLFEKPAPRPAAPAAAKAAPEEIKAAPKRPAPSPFEKSPAPSPPSFASNLEEALDRAFDEVLDEPLPELQPEPEPAPLPQPKAQPKPEPKPAPKPAPAPQSYAFSNDESQAVAAPPLSFELEAAQDEEGTQKFEALTRELEQASAKKAQTTRADKERLTVLSGELGRVERERGELAAKVAKMEESLKKTGEVARLKSSEAQVATKRVVELEGELRELAEDLERLKKRAAQAELTAENRLNQAFEAELTAIRAQGEARSNEFAEWREKQNQVLRRKEEEVVGLKLALASAAEEHKAELAQANQIAAAQLDEQERKARQREDAMGNEITQREERYETRLGEAEAALRAETLRLNTKVQENEELGARIAEMMKEREGLQASLARALMAQDDERRQAELREADLKTEIARLEDLNRQNEERILRAYHKIKADAELRARSERAMAAALEMVRNPKD